MEAILLIAFFLLIAFPVHEFFHAYAANRLGDTTPRMFGRLTLNPIAHFHPVGGTMLVISVLVAGIPLGFAATPINPGNLRGRYGEAIVAGAGPLSNLVLAAAAAIPLRFVLGTELQFEYPILLQTLGLIVYGNIILGLFNLVPIPPLDGGAILLSLVSRETAWQLRPILAQYGLLILIGVFFFPVFGGETLGGRVLYPIADAIFTVLVG
jgi:Zn-dependent protease